MFGLPRLQRFIDARSKQSGQKILDSFCNDFRCRLVCAQDLVIGVKRDQRSALNGGSQLSSLFHADTLISARVETRVGRSSSASR